MFFADSLLELAWSFCETIIDYLHYHMQDIS